MIKELSPVITNIRDYYKLKYDELTGLYGNDSDLLDMLRAGKDEIDSFEQTINSVTIDEELHESVINDLKRQANSIKINIYNIEGQFLHSRPELRGYK